ncbi:MAG: hypothetical protein SRB2_02717 [Desulfobacteraceae bacterium Eth-SRB2]|nr:MAG: hypothetical protein SRB2_02717 [Desulfobacteraceae bacterium Eth-SRB2]
MKRSWVIEILARLWHHFTAAGFRGMGRMNWRRCDAIFTKTAMSAAETPGYRGGRGKADLSIVIRINPPGDFVRGMILSSVVISGFLREHGVDRMAFLKPFIPLPWPNSCISVFLESSDYLNEVESENILESRTSKETFQSLSWYVSNFFPHPNSISPLIIFSLNFFSMTEIYLN